MKAARTSWLANYRVVEKYENQEKPTFEKDYGVLLDAIQSLLGASYQMTDEKRQKRIESRIEDLAESLENLDGYLGFRSHDIPDALVMLGTQCLAMCVNITLRYLQVAISLALRNAWCHPSPHLA